MNGGFNPLLLAAVRPGDRVLDIGCGTGQLTRLAATAGHPARQSASTCPCRWCAAPRPARGRGLSNVRFVHADAQVHPFPAGTFDVALSRFGVMFFGDPVAAFGAIGRALRPGGLLRFVCLDNGWGGDLGSVLGDFANHLPPSPTDGTAVAEPLSLADPRSCGRCSPARDSSTSSARRPRRRSSGARRDRCRRVLRGLGPDPARAVAGGPGRRRTSHHGTDRRHAPPRATRRGTPARHRLAGHRPTSRLTVGRIELVGPLPWRRWHRGERRRCAAATRACVTT
ncbi:methyltransferase domain-containing protein [Micromonospora sp. M12]